MLANAEWPAFSQKYPDAVNTTIGILIDPDSAKPWRPKTVAHAREEALKDITVASEYGYQGQAGNMAFLDEMKKMAFGKDITGQNGPDILAYQTLGGTGALNQSKEALTALMSKSKNNATALVLDPGWPNHPAIFSDSFKIYSYAHLNTESGAYDHQAAVDTIMAAPENSVLLFQTCGYNDDGADRTQGEWDEIIDIAEEKNAVVILDSAYMGLASGLDLDRYPITRCVQKGLLTFVCVSCSKNMGLYNERVGALFITNVRQHLGDKQSQNLNQLITRIVRRTISSPPLLAAKAAGIALGQETYYDELEKARQRLVANRDLFASYIADNFPNVYKGSGLFTKLLPDGFTDKQQAFLRSQGILALPNSRINLGGMNIDEIKRVGSAIQETISIDR